jgi:4a-hydroxytetrahydrobiopterin dehydratase
MTADLSRTAASDAVTALGWRLVLGELRAWIAVRSLAQAVDVAARVVSAAGDDADEHVRLDVRGDGVDVAVQSSAAGAATSRDVELASQISAALHEAGVRSEPASGRRSVQVLEIAIDAMDIPAIRPFWRAVLGYADEEHGSGPAGPTDALVDPLRQGPAVWFQQMSEPRPQRNRIHLDISVPHDEAAARIEAARDAGGVLVSDSSAPAYWVLADVEGNEACITTWQGRDG